MTLENTIEQFNEIFIEVLDEEDIVLKYETSADDIEDWDSLNHIRLVISIEKHFDIKFTANEIETYKNVGEMCEAVMAKKS